MAWLTVAPALLAGTALAYEIRSIETHRDEQRFRITMTVKLELPAAAVRERLTDYENLDKLSPAIEDSRRLRPDEAGDIIVYRRMRPCVMFVCKTLRIFETVAYPGEWEIVTTVIAARSDLAYGLTRWTLTPEGTGTLLEYESEVEPGFDLFPVVGQAAMSYSLRKQARQFAEGLERRR
ncbi:MAG: SRPBCC family protein [Woeseiaceae bacterium]